MKKIAGNKFVIFCTVLFLSAAAVAAYHVSAVNTEYGVFVGLSPKNISKLYSYKEVVIDAEYYTKGQIDTLHAKGIKVYSYLNVGSIEDFRGYYKQFESMSLGDYYGWPGEKWMDVSKVQWQDYVVNTIAKNLSSKGVDGFFIDNADVYAEYKEDRIFEGLNKILGRLNSTYNKKIIVNGGYEFFTKAVTKNIDLKSVVYGINQESVYTLLDVDRNRFKLNPAKERNFVVEYLKGMKARGLMIYVTEYSKNSVTNEKVESFYTPLGFKFYIAKSKALN